MLMNLDMYMWVIGFINIHMNVNNAKKSYIVKRRKYMIKRKSIYNLYSATLNLFWLVNFAT